MGGGTAADVKRAVFLETMKPSGFKRIRLAVVEEEAGETSMSKVGEVAVAMAGQVEERKRALTATWDWWTARSDRRQGKAGGRETPKGRDRLGYKY